MSVNKAVGHPDGRGEFSGGRGAPAAQQVAANVPNVQQVGEQESDRKETRKATASR